MLYNLAFEYAIRRVQVNQDRLEIKWCTSAPAYAADVNILGGSVHTIKKNAEAVVVC